MTIKSYRLPAIAGLLALTAATTAPLWTANAQDAAPTSTTPPAAAKALDSETVDNQISYTIGANIGASMRRDNLGKLIQLNPKLLAAGLLDALASDDQLKISMPQMQAAMTALQEKMQKQQEQQRIIMEQQGQKNLAAGTAFLATNGKKEGVTTTATGLQYEVIAQGSGQAKPKLTDTVTVHYRGTLMDGTEFDSSHKRGQPATFPVGGVIPGWTEALQLMTAGTKLKLTIPANLAYGAQGSPPVIPPHSVLVFEVELLSIAAPSAPAAAPQQP